MASASDSARVAMSDLAASINDLRVDTVAAAICNHDPRQLPWDRQPEEQKSHLRWIARGVLLELASFDDE